MRKLKHNQDGFFTMILMALIILGVVLYFTYVQVAKAQQ